MNNIKSILLLFLFCLSGFISYAQDTLETPTKWQFKGYLKSLQTTYFVKIPPFPEALMLNDHLLHNRLNLKYFPSENLTFSAELRTRLFWGDGVKTTQQTGGDFIGDTDRGSDDFFDWSFGRQSNRGYAFHTTLDRFYGEFSKDNWEIRLGRQRVNWGISTIWNPNDIFNAFSFTDFDYEERPGSDALRVKRYIGVASSVEIAVKAADEWKEATGAILTKFHIGTYDLQVLTGVAENHVVLGGGWAGNLGNAGFKGEGSFFHPLEDSLSNSFAMTFGVDYTLANQMYLNVGALYNSNGSKGVAAQDLFNFELSARNLYPYRYAVLTQVGYPITPLLNSALIVVYSPGKANALFLNPVLTCSIAQNWDIDLVGQIVFQDNGKQYESPVQAGFLRVKWSF